MRLMFTLKEMQGLFMVMGLLTSTINLEGALKDEGAIGIAQKIAS